MPHFLSNDWFDKVAELNKQAGDLPLSPTIAQAVFNAEIEQQDAPVSLHFRLGKLHQGLADKAQASLKLDANTLQSLITARDINIALEAFMTGKIRIEGDMSALLALQSAKPSQEQKALYKEILAMTEF